VAERKTALQASAGGVVYRRRDDGQIEVALIATHEGQRWGLPKGAVRKAETPEEAALREVAEETGLSACLVDKIDTIDYWFQIRRGSTPVLIHKTVDFFLMEATGGDVADHDWEVDEARWFTLDDAIQAASYDSERDILQAAATRL
jgi:8-oxo-dGTP diphosphatase